MGGGGGGGRDLHQKGILERKNSELFFLTLARTTAI